MNVRYRVELSQAERAELEALLGGGKHAARKLKRAQILLAADAAAGDEEIARNVGVSGSTAGFVLSFSQFTTVSVETPIRSATSHCKRRSCRRCFLRCSPKVSGFWE
jgi:hypothetical protein